MLQGSGGIGSAVNQRRFSVERIGEHFHVDDLHSCKGGAHGGEIVIVICAFAFIRLQLGELRVCEPVTVKSLFTLREITGHRNVAAVRGSGNALGKHDLPLKIAALSLIGKAPDIVAGHGIIGIVYACEAAFLGKTPAFIIGAPVIKENIRVEGIFHLIEFFLHPGCTNRGAVILSVFCFIRRFAAAGSKDTKHGNSKNECKNFFHIIFLSL